MCSSTEDLQREIRELCEAKHAKLFAHYYVPDEVQDIADEIGDSFFLARRARETDAEIIVLCGVQFMGESAKILNPEKKVLIPALNADCPVVCYVNSTAELKAHSDVCVTSANALKIVSKLPNEEIYFIPDQNLAHYIADQLPEKKFIFNDGFCHVHHSITKDQMAQAKAAKPNALVCVHPECKTEVVAMADYVGSTSGIINFVDGSDAEEFIIATEMGVMHSLRTAHPDKKFYTAGNMQLCPNMKKVSLERVRDALLKEDTEIHVDEDLMKEAYEPMMKMLELAK